MVSVYSHDERQDNNFSVMFIIPSASVTRESSDVCQKQLSKRRSLRQCTPHHTMPCRSGTWQFGDRRSHSLMVRSREPERKVSLTGDIIRLTTLGGQEREGGGGGREGGREGGEGGREGGRSEGYLLSCDK